MEGNIVGVVDDGGLADPDQNGHFIYSRDHKQQGFTARYLGYNLFYRIAQFDGNPTRK
jgi:hypothetical protein